MKTRPKRVLKFIIHETNVINGKKLKEYREKNNISGVKLAEKLGVHQTTYYRWEKGLRPIVFESYNTLLDMGVKLKHPIYNRAIDLYSKNPGPRGPYKRTKKEKVTHVLKEKEYYKENKNGTIKRKRLYVDIIANIDYLSKFGEKLKDIRYNFNLTLQQMADRLDVNYTHLWKLEQGEAITIRVSTIKALIDMGISIDDLFLNL